MADENEISARPALSAAFNKVAQRTVADFPELEGRFLLIDLDAGEIHGEPNMLKTAFSTVEEVEAYINDAAQSAIESGTSSSTYSPEHKLSIIFFNSAGQTSFGGAAVEEALGIIDHEIGHIVVKGALETSTFSELVYAETAADLYASMSHARRNGNDPAAIRTLAFNRAYGLVTRGDEDTQAHFTAFALLELADMAKTTDFSKMEPRLAAGMAEMLAQQYALTEPEVKMLADTFKDYRAKAETGIETALKYVAQQTLAPDASPAVERLGGFMLSFYLDGKISVDGKPVRLAGAEWDDVRAQLKQKTERPAAPAGIILLPQKSGFKPPAL
ncbi:MAG: hypothetical protein PW788_06900 [Micavibrio sp.]|nr:hypothetical protein [Micavibrio sp.]